MSKYTEDFHSFERVTGIFFRTLQDISWYLDDDFIITVPRDFIFDVSVPSYLQWLFHPDDVRYFKAAALHDYLLKKGWSRLVAGGIFHDALKADQVPVIPRLTMWLAVSLWKYNTITSQGDING